MNVCICMCACVVYMRWILRLYCRVRTIHYNTIAQQRGNSTAYQWNTDRNKGDGYYPGFNLENGMLGFPLPLSRFITVFHSRF